MEIELRQALTAEMNKGSMAYVRNLAAAEQAVLRGQFNLAKVLRAAAHAQRVMAMNAARLLADQIRKETILDAVLSDIQEPS
jgi:rubrerythrin